MFEKRSKRLVPIGQAHPWLRWPILGLLVLCWCLDGAVGFARALGLEIRAVRREAVAHLRETGLTPQGIHNSAERLLDAGIRAAKKLPGLWNHVGQDLFPLVYTKGLAAWNAARPRSLARMDAAKAAAPVYLARAKAFAQRTGCGVAGFARRAAGGLRADLPEWKRHAPSRAMAAALALALCLGMLPVSSFASEAAWKSTCPHDLEQHNGCGYVAAVEGAPCAHTEHADCGYAEAVPGTDCACGAVAGADGTVVHLDGCAYVPATGGTPCKHDQGEHDESCGFTEAVAETPCTHIHDETCGGLPPAAEPPQEPEIPEPPACSCGAAAAEDGNIVHLDGCAYADDLSQAPTALQMLGTASNIVITDGTHILYANGTPLVITAGSAEKASTIYIDSNGNGVVDNGEQSLNEAGLPNAPADNTILSRWTIYGGGTTETVGDAKITMTGGRVTYLVGGGSNAPVTGSTEVIVTGGEVSLGVYGGGLGNINDPTSEADVGGNTTVTIGGSALVEGDVYGGGNMGNVDGSATVRIEDGAQVVKSVYGGGTRGSVGGGTTVTITGGTVTQDVYGSGSAGIYGSVSGGDAAVTITGGTVSGSVYGSGASGEVSGTTVIIGGTAAVSGSVYGGGWGGSSQVLQDSAVTIDGSATVSGSVYGGGLTVNVGGSAAVTVAGGTISGRVYGGGFGGKAIRADVGKDTTVTITGGEVSQSVYGGGYRGNVGGSATVAVTGGTVKQSVYGGPCLDEVEEYPATVKGGSTVIVGNTAKVGQENTEYGVYINGTGVENGVATFAIAPKLESGALICVRLPADCTGILGTGAVADDLAQIKLVGAHTADKTAYFYGGNITLIKPIPVTGVSLDKTNTVLPKGSSATLTPTVTPENADVKTVTWSSGNESIAKVDSTTGRVTAVAKGTATITATTTDGGFTAACTVTVTDPPKPGTASDAYGKYIYANGAALIIEAGSAAGKTSIRCDLDGVGGIGDAEYFMKDADLSAYKIYGGGKSSLDCDTSITMTGGTVGYLYGGGRGADVNGNTMIDISGTAVVRYPIYGGGDGTSSDAVNSRVTGKATVNITGGEIWGNVYGGATVSGTGRYPSASVGSTEVHIGGSTIIKGTKLRVYGGGDYGSVGSTSVLIDGGTRDADNTEFNVYGGGECGVVTGNTTVTIASGAPKVDALYGGGYDPYHSANTTVSGSSNITIKGGTVGYLYGGSGQAPTNKVTIGSTNISVEGGTVSYLYGGGVNSTVEGDTKVTVTGGKVGTLYGGVETSTKDSNGVKSGMVKGNTAVTITDNGVVTGNVYGGGESEWFPEATSTVTVTVGKNARVGSATDNYGIAITTGNFKPNGVKSFAIDPDLESGAQIYTSFGGDPKGLTIATGAVESDLAHIALGNYHSVTGYEPYFDSAKNAIKVGPAVTALTLDKTTLALDAGSTQKLTATVTPSTAAVTWSTSDAGVATVAKGVVTAVGAGTATITAKAGSKTATCAVTVNWKTMPTITVTPYTGEYDGNLHDRIVKVEGAPVDSTVTYSTNGADFYTVMPQQKDVTTGAPVWVRVECANYESYTSGQLNVVITKAAYPNAPGAPALTATYGQKLSDLTPTTENGTWSWENGETLPTVGNSGYKITFTPTDTNYNPVEHTAAVTVTPKAYDASGFTIVDIAPLTYNGAEQTPKPEVKFGATILAEGEDQDYTLSHKNHKDAGTGTVTVAFHGNFSESAEKTFTISQKPLTTGMFPAIDKQSYTGQPIRPPVILTDGDPSILTSDDYELEYTGNVSVGTATVTATAKPDGNYAGSVSTTFLIEDAVLPENITNDQIFDKSTADLSKWANADITLSGRDGWTVGKAANALGDSVPLNTESTSADGTVEKLYVGKDDKIYTTTVTYALDKTAPTIAYDDATGGNPASWISRDATITFTAADALSGVASVTVADSAGKDYPVPDQKSFVADKNDTYTIMVTDNAGKTTTRTVIVGKIDKATPAAPTVSGYTTAVWAKDTITFALATTDTATSVPSGTTFQVKVGTADWVNVSGVTYAVTENTDGVTHSFRTISGADVVSGAVDFVVKLDKEAPVVSLSAKANGADYTGAATAYDVVVTLTNGKPNLSGQTWYYQKAGDADWTKLDADTLTIGENCNTTFTFKAVSGAGIASATQELAVLRSALTDEEKAATQYGDEDIAIDKTPGGTGWYTENPTITVTKQPTVGTSGLAATTYYKLYKAPDTDATPQTLSGNEIALPSDGEWTLKIWTEDAAGNKTEPFTVTAKVDKTAPEAPTVTIPGTGGVNGWHNTAPVEITVAVTDGTSGVSKWEYSTDGGKTWTTGKDGKFTISEDGTYQVQVKVTDNAGNVTTPAPAVEVKIDKTAPGAVLGGVPGVGTWTKDNVTITVTGSDLTAGLADKPYSFDGGKTWQAGNTKTYMENTTDIVIHIKDAAGNVKILDAVAVTGIDKTAPAAPSVKIGGYEVETSTAKAFGKTIDITLTPTPGSPETYTYILNDNEGADELTEKKEFSLNAASGSNTLIITITDAAGNKMEKTYAVNITTAIPDAPTIDVGNIPGLGDAFTKADVMIPLPDENKAYVYREKPNGEWKPVKNGKLVFNKDSDSGDYELAEKITVDDRNYYGEPADITVKIDKTAPTIDNVGITAAPGLDEPTNQPVIITIPIVDDGSGIHNVTVTPSGNATVTGPADGKYTVTVTENGEYTVAVTDKVGNTSTTTQEVTGIDKTKPTVTVTPETDSGKWYGKTELAVTATDPSGSGVASTVITVDGKPATSSINITEKGEHPVVITVTDAAGNETKVTKLVNVDPTIDDFKAAVDGLGETPAIEAVQDVLDRYLGLTDDEKAHIQNSDTGKDAWNDLQDELKKQQDAIKDKVSGILDKENPTISDINDAENLFDILDKTVQDSIDKSKLDQLIKDRDAAQTVIDQIQNADSYEEQKAAVDAYGRLTEDQKELADGVLTPGMVTDMKTDVAKVDEVIKLIDAVKKPYTPATQAAIEKAKDAYHALDADQEKLLPAYEEEKLDSLSTQLDRAKAVEDKISALTKPYDASENTAIKAAQEAYGKLTADEKNMVGKDLKAKLDELYKAMLDAIATGNAAVDKVIQDIIKVENDPSRTVEDIQRVEDAYNKLPQDAKDKVDIAVVTAPSTTAKDVLDQLVQDKDAVKDLVDDLSKLNPDKLIPGNVTEIGNAKDSYDILTEGQKKLVDNSTGGKLEDLTQAVKDAKKTEEAIEKIPDHTDSATNQDGTPNLGQCGNSGNGNSDNTTTGGHTMVDHKTAIEEAKYAYEMLSDAGRKLIAPAVVAQLNTQYSALMSYLEYINRKEVSGAAVEVVGLAEKVDAPTPPIGGKTVIAVELKVEEPPAAIKPVAPAGKTQALSVDVKLVATKLNSDGTKLNSQQVQPTGGNVLVKLLLPNGYDLDTLEIVHVKDSGAQYSIRNFHIATETDGVYAVFEVSSFSHFVFYAEKEAVSPTPGDNSGNHDGTSSAPSVPPTENGSITVTPAQPKPGTSVAVTPKPDEGYVVDKIVVTDQSGKEIPVKDNGDGTYSYTQPKGKVTLTVTFKSAPKPQESPFTDVGPGEWFYESVKYVYEKGLMNGTGGNTFGPYMATSRGMIVTILWRLEGEPDAKGANPFVDMPADAYYVKAVAWAAENGIVTGYGNGNFGPNDSITREQLAVILHRYTQFKGQETPPEGMAIGNFSDNALISGYARDAVRWALGQGIVNGKGNNILDPKGDATRAEAAVMLMRYLQA